MKHKKPADSGTTLAEGRLLYSLKEAAFQLSISKRSLAYLTAQGTLPVRKIGGRTLIAADVLRAFAKSGTRGILIVPTAKAAR